MGLDAVKMELFKLKTQLIGVSKGIIGAVNTVDATIQMVDATVEVDLDEDGPAITKDEDANQGAKLIKLPDDTSMLNRLEWVGHFRAAVDELEADKKLMNRRSHLVNLRTIIDKAIADLDKLLEADPE